MNNNRSNVSKMGKYICNLRKQKGYTQKQLGEILDVSDKTISKWELGTIAPDITILSSLADAFGVSVLEILNGEDNIIEIKDKSDSLDISTYSNQTRKKIFKDILITIFFFSIIILFFVSLKNNNRWTLKEINVDGDITFRGFIVNSTDKTKLFINKIILNLSSDVRDIKNIKIEVFDKKELLMADDIIADDIDSLLEKLNSYTIFWQGENINNDKELLLVFTIYYENNSVLFQYYLE